MKIDRRRFLGLTAGALASRLFADERSPRVDASKLPRWRGFNLLEKFTDRHNAPFVETDFQWMAEWGFDFVRLPLSYWCWSAPDNWREMDESVLKQIDDAIAFGKKHGVHVNINFHRAPGFCVNPPAEPFDLWTDDTALEAATFHWATFANRYKGIPNEEVSFDLLNEPPAISEESYTRVATALVEAIRNEDADRLIVADGLRWGREPVFSLVDLGVAQSARGYDPMRISHHKASWISGSDRWETPSWPLKQGDEVWDKDRLRRDMIDPWKKLEARGVGVHVGEWGAFQHTPHEVALAWQEDFLSLWREAGWGWAMWNFRGSFGILDSHRADVEYEDFQGHKLDRAMLELIRRY